MANRMAALELLLSAKNSDLIDIHRLPGRLRRSWRVGSTQGPDLKDQISPGEIMAAIP
jgi:hypothetical protein